ncbi:MAG: histone deacetylase [Deltaproteobacteria bacterium]|nr:histone deacetylase [Deltaproteobacteria bacterium]
MRRVPTGLLQSASLWLTRAHRLLSDAGLPLRPRAKLIYHDDYLGFPAEFGARRNFDVQRPRRIIDKLRKAGVLSRRQLLAPACISHETLSAVHSTSYLDQLKRPDYLYKLLHVSADPLQIDDPLLPFLRQCGGTVLAAQQALDTNRPAINLGGGFHHAQRDRGEGFCPINDIAVAIVEMRRRRLADRALVIDLDYHHGNGTAAIFADDERTFTCSIHGQAWADSPDKQHNLDIVLPGETNDQRYLATLAPALESILKRFRPDLAIYVAGADPHIDDAFGNFALSSAGLLARDLMVHAALSKRRIPLCVVLAGGYGPLAWTVPYNFIFSLLTGHEIAPSYQPDNIAASFDRTYQHLSPQQLTRQDDVELNDDDGSLAGDLKERSSQRFLGYYTREGIELALERYGFLELVRERGFDELRIAIDVSDPSKQALRVYDRQIHQDHLLVELVTALTDLSLPTGDSRFRMLHIHWLCMQNPRAEFSLDRPPLPGQHFPGLGLGRWVVELLRLMAARLECDGLMNSPDHFHNAALYSKYGWRYLDPQAEAQFAALTETLGDTPLVEAAQLIENQHLIDQSGQPLVWRGQEQVLSLNTQIDQYFASPDYRAAYQRARKALHFRLRLSPSSDDRS